MKLSVIIPNLNTPVIDKTINSLIAQSLNPDCFEIIVVGKDDFNVMTPNSRIQFDVTERPYSPAEARNRGVRQASGDFIVFLDADCICPPDWLAILYKLIENRDFDMIGGGVCTPRNNYWTLADNLSMFHEFMVWQPACYRSTFPSLNLSIRRSAFNSVRGFDESYPVPSGEDFELTERLTRAGYQGWFEPSFWIYHEPPRHSLSHLLRHGFFQGKYSTKIRYPNRPGSFPAWLRSPWVLRFFSLIIALIGTIKIFAQPHHWKFLLTFPGIFASKVAWCFGAATKPDWKGIALEAINE